MLYHAVLCCAKVLSGLERLGFVLEEKVNAATYGPASARGGVDVVCINAPNRSVT